MKDMTKQKTSDQIWNKAMKQKQKKKCAQESDILKNNKCRDI